MVPDKGLSDVVRWDALVNMVVESQEKRALWELDTERELNQEPWVTPGQLRHLVGARETSSKTVKDIVGIDAVAYAYCEAVFPGYGCVGGVVELEEVTSRRHVRPSPPRGAPCSGAGWGRMEYLDPYGRLPPL